MKVRMAVARCCCPRKVVPPAPLDVGITSAGYYSTAINNTTDIPANVGWEFSSTGINGLRNGWIYMGVALPVFNGLPIPPGSTVTQGDYIIDDLVAIGLGAFRGQGNAYLDVTLAGSPPIDGTYTTRIRIYGALELNPSQPTNVTDMTAIPRTTAFVDWDITATISGGSTVLTPQFSVGNSQQSPSLTPILQEIVDQPGWASENAALLLLEDNGSDGVAGNYGFGAWFEDATPNPQALFYGRMEVNYT